MTKAESIFSSLPYYAISGYFFLGPVPSLRRRLSVPDLLLGSAGLLGELLIGLEIGFESDFFSGFFFMTGT